MTDFGQQLKNLRTRFGLTQSDLAAASSLGQSTISALENGRQGPWPSTRRSLAHAFHMTMEEFDAEIAGRPVVTGSDRLSFRPDGPPPAPWAAGLAVGSPGPAPEELRFAPAKVMELLNQLGHAEAELQQYRSFVQNVCAACWTTDATLHLTGSFGPVAAELRNRHGDFAGRHISELCEAVWGATSEDFEPFARQQRAADGVSGRYEWTLEGRRFAVFVDPITEPGGQVIGTVGLAVDITERES